MKDIRFSTTIATLGLSSLLVVGCGGDASEAPPAPPPQSSPGISLETTAPAAPAPVAAPAPGAAPSAAQEIPADPAAEQAALQARIAAGEEGTTPDPVEDRHLGQLQTASDSFYNEFKRPPSNLQEMVTRGHLSRVPAAPTGKKYVVDATNGEVKLVNSN